MLKQTRQMKRLVRRIQYWLKQHEYQSDYKGLRLHSCEKHDSVALCRTGVVYGWGGGCIIEPWINFTTAELARLFERAKKEYENRGKAP